LFRSTVSVNCRRMTAPLIRFLSISARSSLLSLSLHAIHVILLLS
jgi:hypothetical protein